MSSRLRFHNSFNLSNLDNSGLLADPYKATDSAYEDKNDLKTNCKLFCIHRHTHYAVELHACRIPDRFKFSNQR